MKSLKRMRIAVLILLFITVFTPVVFSGNIHTPGAQINIERPVWAPSYIDGVRYFYLPDIECYYDLYSRDFIFLYNGQWRVTPDILRIYDDFDLNGCFVVVLDSRVYRPWMHHQYYLSHYPRYYYRYYYDHSNYPYVRGFDENGRKAIFWKENERNRARSWDNDNFRNERKFRYTKEDRQEQKVMHDQLMNQPSREDIHQSEKVQEHSVRNQNPNKGNAAVGGQPQNPGNRVNPVGNNSSLNHGQSEASSKSVEANDANYYGKTIGRPVRVEKQMRDQKTGSAAEKIKNSNEKKDVRSNSGRR